MSTKGLTKLNGAYRETEDEISWCFDEHEVLL